jgi:tetratricopeptide (TPR) repeat protein
MSNLAAALLCLNRTEEAEQYWLRCVKLQPSFFEASEHLIGLLGEEDRKKEAVEVVDYVEKSLWIDLDSGGCSLSDIDAELAGEKRSSPRISRYERPDYQFPDRNVVEENILSNKTLTSHVFGPSGYAIPPSDNGRMLALIHAKGNMLYQLGDNLEAARAFENAILLGAGKQKCGIRSLIEHILQGFSDSKAMSRTQNGAYNLSQDPILLLPEEALETSRLVFPPQGDLPGLREVPNGMAKRAAIAIVSNSLLSLAKIYQDGLSSNGASVNEPKAASGVQEILALYYLSLSLQPSPSTANNVGILLASVQQTTMSQPKISSNKSQTPLIPGVVPGSGIALALAYYNYGLNLDSRHAHLYTNLGSLFKDIGQLNAAIKMYEKAVDCDGNFDIALANLANAVKDQGRISDAITYYRRAVSSNPEFSEAVCGLANALNSVCNWSGRGGVTQVGGKYDRWHVDDEGMLYDSRTSHYRGSGWIEKVVSIVEKQLQDGESWGKGILRSIDPENLLKQFGSTYGAGELGVQNMLTLRRTLESWIGKPWEGAKVVRLVERATKRLGWQWYWDKYICRRPGSTVDRTRPQLPAALAIPSAPTVLPFHTFTCPLSAKQIRSISQRNGLRISCSTLRAPWLPARIYKPPAPPNPHFNVGYVSSDFNNHPLAHLMQSVFGFHNKNRVQAFCYATTAGDGSVHRQQIEQEAPVFYDASSWSTDRLVNQIVEDGIHILVNLNGYTRGARNEVFAARPSPIQMSFMGFAGTLGAEWCDYLLADEIAVPPQTLRPWRRNVDLMDQTRDENNEDDTGNWIYGENIIFTRDTFFCCDHRQSAPDSQGVQLDWAGEQARRWAMRRELFPKLADDVIILANFNQLYKVGVNPSLD